MVEEIIRYHPLNSTKFEKSVVNIFVSEQAHLQYNLQSFTKPPETAP